MVALGELAVVSMWALKVGFASEFGLAEVLLVDSLVPLQVLFAFDEEVDHNDSVVAQMLGCCSFVVCILVQLGIQVATAV
jgi:hypothetical protein